LAFPLQSHAHPIIDTRRNLHFQVDLKWFQADTIAGSAWIADGPAAAAANGASGLDSQHTGRLDDLTTTLASFAGFRLRSGGGSRPGAGFACSVTCERDGFGDPASCFLKFERDIAAEVGTFADSRSASSSAEEVLEDGSAEDIAKRFKDVSDVTETTLAFDACMTVAVVASPFLFVAQNLVRFGGLLELVSRILVALIGVGMVLHREFSIRLGYLRGGSGAIDPSDFIVVPFGIRIHKLEPC
jgi:hypothetical protein